jgi:nitrite reductase (NO-forming)
MTDQSKQNQDERLKELEERLNNRSLVSGGIAVFAVLGIIILSITLVAVAQTIGSGSTQAGPLEQAVAQEPAAEATPQAAPAADDPAAKDVKFEEYEWVDPTLPAVPKGKTKVFDIDVYEHVTKVTEDLAPTRVWSYAVNGKEYRGTGVSAPLVVNEGDDVKMILHNGSSKKMDVQMPHSIDFHSSEVAPNVAFATINPGEKHVFEFEAKHPGVFMYHCATAPVLHHTAAGMVGMMVVKPKDLKPVDKELWINQQEYYIGAPGEDADYAKAQAKTPDVIAFNGYGNQYVDQKPISVEKDEKVRMYVLNSGPSIWSAFHVIGTVFDKAVVEGSKGTSAQTINLAPSQGGYVEFSLDEEGTYPFVTHAFGDMEKGAVGALQTKHAESDGGGH